MKRIRKKIAKLVAACLLTTCLFPVAVYAEELTPADSMDTVGEEDAYEEILPGEETSEELTLAAGDVTDPVEELLQDPVIYGTKESEGSEQTLTDVDEAAVITGVDAPERTRIHMEFKPALDVLLEEFPDTVTVHFGDKTGVIKTGWVCDGDYNEYLGEYTFIPDLEDYTVAEDIELPRITVTFDNEGTGPVGEVSDYDLEYEVPLLSSLPRLRKGTSEILPDYYNLYEDKKLPKVKNQNPYGSCWAFSSIGSMETDLISDGTVSSPDLSELHLAYYAANNYCDPEECHTDTVDNMGKNWVDNGGHIVVAARLMTQLVGAVDEETASYDKALSFKPDDSYITSKDSVRAVNAYFISPKDRVGIKKAIMEHGGVAASYYETQLPSEFNSKKSCYYYSKECKDPKHNHAVMFVGWDDNFPKENFVSTPEGNGAWLVRNSWGLNDYGHSGYFWMSYYDKSWNSTKEVVAYDTTEDLFDNCYAYDGHLISGWIYDIGPSDTVYVDYPVSAGERVQGVSFELSSTNATATVTVTNKKTNISVTKTVKTTYAGIYTAEFDEPLEFADGADAEISLKFKGDDGKAVKLMCENSAKSTTFGKYKFVYTGRLDNGFNKGNTRYDNDPRVRLYTDSYEKHVFVEGVKLSASSLSLTQGDTTKLTATVLPDKATKKKVKWESSNTAVATVSSDGTVTAVAPGSATITVTTAENRKTATCNVVTVKPVPVSGVNLSATSKSVKVGNKFTLTATVIPANADNKKVTWSSGNKKIATVSADGVVKGVKPGTVTITVTTADGGKTASCKVTVKEVTAKKIKLNKSKATVKTGNTLQLKATFNPTNTTNKNITWTTSKKSVATVTKKGVVKAVGRSGTATITAKTSNGKKATCKVTVKYQKVKGVKLNKKTVTVKKGKTYQLKATISPDDASDKSVTWKSKDKKVATVNSKGVVKGKKKGKTTITVTTKDGKETAKCTVIVK